MNEFVHHGGVLFGFARCASLTEKGWYSHELPPAPLKEVFGIIKAEPDLLKNRKIILDGEYFDGHINRDKLVLDEGTQVLATFNDGYPAVIVHPFHQGKGVYISSQLDAAYVLSQNKLLPKVIGKLNLPNPRVILNYPEKHRRDIDAHLLTGASGELIVFTNYRNQPAKVKVSINLNDQVISKLEEIFPEKREIPFVNNNKRCEFDLDFKGEEVKTIQIFK